MKTNLVFNNRGVANKVVLYIPNKHYSKTQIDKKKHAICCNIDGTGKILC